MRDIERANELLELAASDLDALDVMSESGRIHERMLGFHAQQAVEKALKAWLALLGVDYPLTHDLDALLSLLEDSGTPEAEQFRDLEILTPFAVQFRYLTYDDAERQFDTENVTRRSRELVAHVRGLVAAAEAADSEGR